MTLKKVNLKAVLRKPKSPKPEHFIYLRITVSSQKVFVSTGQACRPQSWNVKKGRIKSTGRAAKSINDQLDVLTSKVYQMQALLFQEGKEITALSLKNQLIGKKYEQKTPHTLLGAYQHHNDQFEKQVGKKFAYGSFKNHKTTAKFLVEFISFNSNKKDIPLKELSYAFVERFESFLTTQKDCRNNGAMKHIQRLKKVINMALKYEWLEKNPFAKFKLKFKKTERGFLTMKEVESISNNQLPSIKLENTRDVFLLAIWTGLSYIDVRRLSSQHIKPGVDGKLWIQQNRQKSGVKSLIPLLPPALKIIKKYTESNGELKLPVYSSQKTNDYLKEIAILLGIEKRLSFHIARHTFATTITLSNGIPIETVSKMMGHTSIQTTQIYAKVVEQKIADDMRALLNFSK